MFLLPVRWKDTARILEGYRKGNRHPLNDLLENLESRCNFTCTPEGYWKDDRRIPEIPEGYWMDTGRMLEGYWKGTGNEKLGHRIKF